MKLLIVEDYLLVAWALRSLIVTLSIDYEVVGIATCPEQAVRIARECYPVLALVDIRLDRNTSGVDAARQLAALKCKSVYVTAYRGDAVHIPGATLGCLLKPYSQTDIQAMLRACEALMEGREPGPVPRSFILY